MIVDGCTLGQKTSWPPDRRIFKDARSPQESLLRNRSNAFCRSCAPVAPLRRLLRSLRDERQGTTHQNCRRCSFATWHSLWCHRCEIAFVTQLPSSRTSRCLTCTRRMIWIAKRAIPLSYLPPARVISGSLLPPRSVGRFAAVDLAWGVRHGKCGGARLNLLIPRAFMSTLRVLDFASIERPSSRRGR